MYGSVSAIHLVNLLNIFFFSIELVYRKKITEELTPSISHAKNIMNKIRILYEKYFIFLCIYFQCKLKL